MFSVGDNFFPVSCCFLGVAFPFVNVCGSVVAGHCVVLVEA